MNKIQFPQKFTAAPIMGAAVVCWDQRLTKMTIRGAKGHPGNLY